MNLHCGLVSLCRFIVKGCCCICYREESCSCLLCEMLNGSSDDNEQETTHFESVLLSQNIYKCLQKYKDMARHTVLKN